MPVQAEITGWVKDGLTLVKMHEFLGRRGVVVPYRTLARFAAAECGYSSSSRPGVTVPVADGKPGEEVQIDFGYLGMISDGDRPGQGGEHRPVGPVQPRSRVLAPQHRDLLAQHQQLGVLRCRRPCQQCHAASEADEHQIQQPYRHRLVILPAQRLHR